MAFINLKKLSFKTCLKTYGSYVKQSNCKFICYFNKLISYDLSCIIDGELFAGCLLSYIFHFVPWVKEGKAEPRSRWCYTICRVFACPSHSLVRWHLECFSGRHLEAVGAAGVTGDGAITWWLLLMAFGVPGWQRCIPVWGIICGHVQHGRFSAASSVTLYLQLPYDGSLC